MDAVQDRYMRQLEAVAVKAEHICGSEKIISEMMSLLLALNELYDGKISEINTLEEDLEQISELMLSSKAAVFADDAQHLCSLTSAFQSTDWQPRRNFLSSSRKKSEEFFSPSGRPGSDPRRTGPFKGPSSTKERFAQRLKQHRFRRASSDILLRGTKWLNAGKRRHRMADSGGSGSGSQRSLQAVPSTSKNIKMRGMRAGIKCSSSGLRPSVGAADSSISPATGNQPGHLMSPRGGRGRGNSACPSPPMLSASRTTTSSKSRILEQNSRSALPYSRHVPSHGANIGGSSHKSAGDARKRTRNSSVNPEDSRRQGVSSNTCDADSASDQSDYDSNSDGAASLREPRVFDLHKRTQHVFGQPNRDDPANGRFNEDILPSGEGVVTDHDDDLTSNDSTLSNDAYTVNENRSGSRVPSPASKQQITTPSTTISSTAGGRSRTTSSSINYSYRSSLRRSANSPDLVASKSSEMQRSQSTGYHLSKRGRSTGTLRNHSATRSPAPQSPAATVTGFGGANLVDSVNANEGDDTEDDDNNCEDGTTGTGERVYCLCKKVSFGEMIACDNKRCPIEWFHFGCVDIRVQPKGKWYCPQCRGETSKCRRGDA
ncbi:hypothetical protein AAHC03_09879 [Spirometra sp. Aus1]